MIQAVIIDDEKNAREAIKQIVEKHFDDINIIGDADDVSSGVKLISNLQPGLVLLDIKLPDGTGFDILNQFDEINFSTIFITAYNEHAIKAFKFSAIDYLLKPIDIEEFKLAVKKVKKARHQQNTKKKLEAFLENIDNISKEIKKIVLKTSDSIHLINVNEILRCQSEGNYTKFFFINRPALMVSKNIKEYYEMLKDYQFFRPHQSHIVNINFIKQYHKLDGGYLIMQDDSTVPVATRKRDELMKIFERI
ncbi:MAG: LytTR family DNA-binding domain-containing protein [Bacteroidales bacterium]